MRPASVWNVPWEGSLVSLPEPSEPEPSLPEPSLPEPSEPLPRGKLNLAWVCCMKKKFLKVVI